MPFEYPTPGAQHGGAFFPSGLPWVTGSTMAAGTVVHYSFPAVSKRVLVRNTAGAGTLTFAFTQNGLGSVQHNFITLTAGQEENLELRVKDIFLSASSGTPTYEVVAMMTTILYDQFPVLTASVTASHLFSGVG